MRNGTFLAAGSWALALLLGFLAWVPPESGLFPSPIVGAVLAGLALLLFLVGLAGTAAPKGTPCLSFRAKFGAMAPLFAATLALVFAGHGLLPHPSLPLLFTILAGLGGAWWASRVGERLAPTGAWLGITLLMIPTFLIILPVLLFAIGGQALWLITAPNYAGMIDRFNSVNQLTRYRLAPHAGIDADAAGRVLIAISNTGHPDRVRGLAEVPGASPRPWIPATGGFAGWSGDSVMRRAIHGLTKEERSWLQGVGEHPALALVDTIAFASRVDSWSGLERPLSDSLDAFSLPLPALMPIRAAARLQLYRAALAMADHRVPLADSLTREAMGYGLRLRDDADQLIIAAVGIAIAREGAATLAEIRASQGQRALADTLRRLAKAVAPSAYVPDTAMMSRQPMLVRQAIITSLLAHASPRPVEWDLVGLLGITRCTDLREMLYGPTRQAEQAMDVFAERLRNSAGSQEVFALVRRGYRGGWTYGGPAIFRFSAAALGEGRMAGCAALGSMAS